MRFLIVIIFALSLTTCGYDLSQYQHLKNPEIKVKTDQPVIVYTVKGDPGESGKEAFKALFSAFYALKGKHKIKSSAPIARWYGDVNGPKDQWTGEFALKINESVKEIPEKIIKKYPKLELKVWTYGETAEILHIGAYDNETETIKRLHEYIEKSGYEINGQHEEEYIKGPGMFFNGNPDKYQTIIRYPVKKIED